jgi:hypothetical protein
MSAEFDKPEFSFSIIQHRGSPNSAKTVDGFDVHREEKVFIVDLPGFVPCAPYDDHFVYLDPSTEVGRWFAMCTCGSPAVLVGSIAYKDDGSPQGMMLICYIHATTGLHTTGGTKWQ